MPYKGRLAAIALLAATAMSACGSTAPGHRASLTLPASTAASDPPPSGPNTCDLLPLKIADAETGGTVHRTTADPSYFGPHIVCEFATDYADVSLTALQLLQGGRPYTAAQWDTLVHDYDRPRAPLVPVSRLTSDGYYGWIFGPAHAGTSPASEMIAECGFVRHGFAFTLGGQWTRSAHPPSQASMLADCEAIAAKA